MKSTTTFRSFNGTIYVRVPPVFSEYFNLKKQIEDIYDKQNEPECKIEDQDKNKLLITFKKG